MNKTYQIDGSGNVSVAGIPLPITGFETVDNKNRVAYSILIDAVKPFNFDLSKLSGEFRTEILNRRPKELSSEVIQQWCNLKRRQYGQRN